MHAVTVWSLGGIGLLVVVDGITVVDVGLLVVGGCTVVDVDVLVVVGGMDVVVVLICVVLSIGCDVVQCLVGRLDFLNDR